MAGACTSPAAPEPTPSPSPSPEPSLTPSPTDEPDPEPSERAQPSFRRYRVPSGTRPHDVAPSTDGTRVWYTAQATGRIGFLNVKNRRTREVPLGSGSAPHGVIVGPDGDAWVTDGGLNAIVRVDAETLDLERFPLPGGYANLNTGAFDARGIFWFTGQSGIYGRVNPRSGQVRVFDAPEGFGPYGMCADPDGTVWFSSLAGSYIARIGPDGSLDTFEVPTAGGGARRVWSDSRGRLWVTEWNAGKLARFDPRTERWREWRMPGASQPYAVFVDDRDDVWVTDFGTNATVRFDPERQRFDSYRLPDTGSEVRQLLGIPGQVWGAGSGVDKLIVLRT